jgi:hypothetical protein
MTSRSNTSQITPIVLSGFQVTCFIASSFLPLYFWVFPRIAVDAAGFDAQWSVLLLLPVGMVIGWLHAETNRLFPDVAGADLLMAAFGKAVGWVVAATTLFLYIWFVSLSLTLFAYTLRMYFPNTPRLAMLLGMIVVASFGAYKGVETLARTASVVYPLTAIFVVFTFVFIIFQSPHHWFVHRVYHLSAVGKGIYMLIPLFMGFNITGMLSPFYTTAPRRWWYPLIAVMIGGVVMWIIFAAVQLLFGVRAMQDLGFPIQVILQLMRLRGWIIERFGIFVVIFATTFTTVFLSNHIWGLATLLTRVCRQPEQKNYLFLFPVAAAIATVAVLYPNEEVAFLHLRTFLVPSGWLLLVVMPLLVVILGYIRRGFKPEFPELTKAPSNLRGRSW